MKELDLGLRKKEKRVHQMPVVHIRIVRGEVYLIGSVLFYYLRMVFQNYRNILRNAEVFLM